MIASLKLPFPLHPMPFTAERVTVNSVSRQDAASTEWYEIKCVQINKSININGVVEWNKKFMVRCSGKRGKVY